MQQLIPVAKKAGALKQSVTTIVFKASFVLVLFIFTKQSFSQQIPVFSTYYFNKFLVNPGFTGIDNQYRLFGFYRSQWSSLPGRPITGGATAEGSFWKDQIGAGVSVTNDQIGIFNQTNANIAYAQKFKIAKDHQLSIGIMGNAFINRIDFTNARVVDVDPAVATQKLTQTSFDFSLGMSYKWKGLLVGFSVPNILQPNAKYAENGSVANYQYVRHYTAYGEYKFSLLKGKFNITPVLFMRKGPASTYQFDASLMLDYNNLVFISGGYRNPFGAIIMAGVNIVNMFTIAYAYDYTTQPALKGQVGSTHEITAGFHMPSSYQQKKAKEEAKKAKELAESLQKSNDSLQAKLKDSNDQLDSANQQLNNLTQANAAAAKAAQEEEAAKSEDKLKELDRFNYEKEAREQAEKESFNLQNLAKAKDLKGKIFNLDKIYFNYREYTLLPESKEQLDVLVSFLKKSPKIEILIRGYTDNIGSPDFNMTLSDKRAKAVVDYLILKGIDAGRLNYEGLGSEHPVADNGTEEGRHKNRRVEFTILQE